MGMHQDVNITDRDRDRVVITDDGRVVTDRVYEFTPERPDPQLEWVFPGRYRSPDRKDLLRILYSDANGDKLRIRYVLVCGYGIDAWHCYSRRDWTYHEAKRHWEWFMLCSGAI